MVPDQRTPGQVGGDEWQSVATGGELTCGIQLDGSLWCWGRNLSHQGEFELRVPTREPTNSEWKRVVTGYSNMCGIRTDGSLYCWGGLGIYSLESYEPGRVESAVTPSSRRSKLQTADRRRICATAPSVTP